MKKIVSFIACIAIAFALHAEASVGYLMTVNSISDFPEEKQSNVAQQPERNAAIWFENNYVQSGKGRFITLSEAANDDLSSLKAIWVNVDRVGYSNLSALGISEEVVAGLKQYVQNGGNLFVTKQANHLIHQMGRMGYAPTWSSGGNRETTR